MKPVFLTLLLGMTSLAQAQDAPVPSCGDWHNIHRRERLAGPSLCTIPQSPNPVPVIQVSGRRRRGRSATLLLATTEFQGESFLMVVGSTREEVSLIVGDTVVPHLSDNNFLLSNIPTRGRARVLIGGHEIAIPRWQRFIRMCHEADEALPTKTETIEVQEAEHEASQASTGTTDQTSPESQ